MDFDSLSRLAETAEAHRKVLSDYTGSYTLGVGAAAGNDEQPVLILQVEGSPTTRFPRAISLGGESVAVVVRANQQMPTPM